MNTKKVVSSLLHIGLTLTQSCKRLHFTVEKMTIDYMI